jgi:hypothetical protein
MIIIFYLYWLQSSLEKNFNKLKYLGIFNYQETKIQYIENILGYNKRFFLASL